MINHQIGEVSCTFDLPTDFAWDLTLPGKMYEKIKKVFPIIDYGQISEIENKIARNEISQKIKLRHFAEFFNNEKNLSIRIGPLLLSIICSKNYPRWPSYKSHIENILKEFLSLIEIKNFHKITLKYVNFIEIQGKSIELEDYFQFRPYIDPQLPQGLQRFLTMCAFPFNNERDMCRIQIGDLPRTNPDLLKFNLGLEYVLIKSQEVAPKNALEWVEDAHITMNSIFKNCISDRLKKIIGML